MPQQKSLKSFFGGSARGDKKHRVSDISKSTSWNDVDEAQKPGIQKNRKRSSMSSPIGVSDLSDSPVYGQPPAAARRSGAIMHSSIAMMMKKEATDNDPAMKIEESPDDTINLSSKQSECIYSRYLHTYRHTDVLPSTLLFTLI